MDNEDPFKSGFDGAAVLGAGNLSPGTSNVVRIADRFQKGYDPLYDTELLDILRNYFKSGVAVIYGTELECYANHRKAISRLTDLEAGELGLKAPCYFIRAPATEITERVDEIRYKWGPWELRVCNIVIGGWLFNRIISPSLLADLLPDTDLNKVLGGLAEHGLIEVINQNRIVPSRILLYRIIEQVVWLLDTMAPLVYEYCHPVLADKMKYWPPVEKEVPAWF